MTAKAKRHKKPFIPKLSQNKTNLNNTTHHKPKKMDRVRHIISQKVLTLSADALSMKMRQMGLPCHQIAREMNTSVKVTLTHLNSSLCNIKKF